jgi:hypothetical protein
MVQLQPQMFLDKSTEQIRAQVGSAYEIILRDLPVACVDAMIQVRTSPTIKPLKYRTCPNPCQG